jgi:hypothetical protein
LKRGAAELGNQFQQISSTLQCQGLRSPAGTGHLAAGNLFQDGRKVRFKFPLVPVSQGLPYQALPGIQALLSALEFQLEQFQRHIRYLIRAAQPAVNRGIAVAAGRVQRFAEQLRDVSPAQRIAEHQIFQFCSIVIHAPILRIFSVDQQVIASAN